MTSDVFRDRRAAGRELARLLMPYADQRLVTVLALPRGGVPVGYEVALLLHAPLEVLVVRKLGAPGHEEFAMGALARGVRVLDDEVVQQLGVSDAAIEHATRSGQLELERRERLYGGGRPLPALCGHTVIVADDGLATGSTMRAAVKALRAQGASRIVVAVPVGAEAPCEALRGLADEVVCARTPSTFHAVSQWYEDYSQTSDEEVCALLELARNRARLQSPA
jgi:putative phosphoribosyl transferase